MNGDADHPDAGLTLRAAFERHHLPELTGRVSPRTLERYRRALAAWERHSGDPPVGRVDNSAMTAFRNARAAEGLSPNTVNGDLTHLRVMFRRLAPQETGNPMGVGVVARVPYARPLPTERKLPRRVTAAELDAVHAAAGRMTWPDMLPFEPAEWWRALLAVAVGCGPRLGDLLALPADAFDGGSGTLRFHMRKVRAWHAVPVGAVVSAHVAPLLAATADGRGRLFWPRAERATRLTSNRAFYTRWRTLMEESGIDRPFTPHDLRRTCGSLYYRVGGKELAGFVLGHAGVGTTMGFYVDPTEAARDAADRIDWPPAFRALAENPPDPPRPTARRSWSFGLGGAEYLGTPVPLAPRPLAVLRALVAAGRPLSADELATAAWPDRGCLSPVTVKTTVRGLRVALARILEFPAERDPVPFDRHAGGWRLATPVPPADMPAATHAGPPAAVAPLRVVA